MSFWPGDLLDSPTAELWMTFAPASREERSQMKRMGSIAADGRLESMCEAAGLVPGERVRVEFETESPSVEFEITTLLSSGPSYIAARERGRDEVAAAMRAALEPFIHGGIGTRIPQAVEFLIATKRCEHVTTPAVYVGARTAGDFGLFPFSRARVDDASTMRLEPQSGTEVTRNTIGTVADGNRWRGASWARQSPTSERRA